MEKMFSNDDYVCVQMEDQKNMLRKNNFYAVTYYFDHILLLFCQLNSRTTREKLFLKS